VLQLGTIFDANKSNRVALNRVVNALGLGRGVIENDVSNAERRATLS
jgi:hypothetical protein